MTTAPVDPQEEERQRDRQALDRLMLAFLLSGAAATILLGLVFMNMVGRGRGHLGGRLAVAAAAILLLGLIDGHANKLMNRRRPLVAPDSTGFRRFMIWSVIAFFSAAVFLLVVAWSL